MREARDTFVVVAKKKKKHIFGRTSASLAKAGRLHCQTLEIIQRQQDLPVPPKVTLQK
jgi:hypothetical protein